MAASNTKRSIIGECEQCSWANDAVELWKKENLLFKWCNCIVLLDPCVWRSLARWFCPTQLFSSKGPIFGRLSACNFCVTFLLKNVSVNKSNKQVMWYFSNTPWKLGPFSAAMIQANPCWRHCLHFCTLSYQLTHGGRRHIHVYKLSSKVERAG